MNGIDILERRFKMENITNIIREVHKSDDSKLSEIVNMKIAEIIVSLIKKNGDSYDN